MENILLWSNEFLEPIFYKIIYMSIIATIIGIVILTFKKIIGKKISPKWQNILWLLFIIALIMPMKIQSKISIYNYIDISPIEEISNYQEIEQGTTKPGNIQIYEEPKQETIQEDEILETEEIDIKEILPLIWISLVITMNITYIISYFVFVRKIGNKQIKEKQILNILEKCKNKLNIKKEIVVIEQAETKTPAIFGILKTKILVQKNIYNMTEQKLEYILTHELIHYKRKDNIINIAIAILKSVYIFNPFIWIILKQMKKDIEISVDEKVITNLTEQEKKDYCKLLLELASTENNLILREVLCISEEKSNLERRIAMVKVSENLKKNKVKIAIGIIILMIFIGGVFFTQKYQKQYENVPIIYIENEDGTKQALLPISYEWEYKGKTKSYNIEEDFKTMEYDDEYIIWLKKGENKNLVTNEKYKIINASHNTYSLKNGKAIEKNGGNSNSIIMTEYSLLGDFEVGEYVYKIGIDYYDQGSATYAIKALVFEDVEEYKNLLNTKLVEKDKIEKIIDTLKYNYQLKGTEIKDRELILNYEYYVDKDNTYENNLSLFTLIEDLDKITYKFNHKKTQVYNEETKTTEEKEIEKLQVTRDEINSRNKTMIESFKEFIKNNR